MMGHGWPEAPTEGRDNRVVWIEKRLAETLLAALAFLAIAAARTPVRNAGSKYFDDADRALTGGLVSDAPAAAEKGWAAVRTAGPTGPGFLDGIYTASRIFGIIGAELRSDAVYTEGETLCASPGLQLLGLR